MKSKKSKKSKKLPSLKALRRKAWGLMSEYSRRKDVDRFEMTSCVSCGVRNHWKLFDGGHFYHASKQNPVTYDDRNIHAQCRHCNYYDTDAKNLYTLYVEKRYGAGTVEALKILKHQGKEMRRPELEAQIKLLQQKLEQLNGAPK